MQTPFMDDFDDDAVERALDYRASLLSVRDAIDQEGFCYAFIDYSSFSEVKDKKFHELREQFVEAYEKLDSYILENTEE